MSVVVPCYNYGHFLPDAVSTALDQPGLDVEVVIVDDASPDGSGEVAARLAASDPRVRVVQHATNRGHIATYNDGLSRVTGDHVVLMSADDALPPGALTRAVALMQARPEVGMVYGVARSFHDRPAPVDPRVRSWSTWAGRQWSRHACRTGRNVVVSPEVVMRRQAWEEIGGYDPALPHAGDMAVWLDTALRWDIGRVNGPVQAHYRVHADNMHLGFAEGMMLRDLRERMQVLDGVLTTGRPRPADAEALHALARRALAREALRQVTGRGLVRDEIADPAPFLELAAAWDPAVRGSRLWRQAVTPEADEPPVWGRVRSTAASVRRSLLWRRWDRYGL